MARQRSSSSRNAPKAIPTDHLGRLRHWRNRTEPDLSLHFLEDHFKKQVKKPYEQLHAMAAVWGEMIPPKLLPRTRLESLSRGVLHVTVDSSSTLYELDRLLRQGLQQEIIKKHHGPAVRKIQLRVGPVEQEP